MRSLATIVLAVLTGNNTTCLNDFFRYMGRLMVDKKQSLRYDIAISYSICLHILTRNRGGSPNDVGAWHSKKFRCSELYELQHSQCAR